MERLVAVIRNNSGAGHARRDGRVRGHYSGRRLSSRARSAVTNGGRT